MSAPIFFNVPQAREHLLRHGFVVTLRRSRSVGETVARVGGYYKFRALGRVLVKIVRVAPVSRDILDYELQWSGFRDVESWIRAAGKGPNDLYRVALLDGRPR